MKEAIKWTVNRMPKSDDRQLGVMSLPSVAKARFFHSSFPQYSITPLDQLSGMAAYLGLGGLFVKNEAILRDPCRNPYHYCQMIRYA